MTTDIQLIQFPYQLSEAACDPVLLREPSLKHSMGYDWVLLGNGNGYYFYFSTKHTTEPQDYGIETFAGDTLEGGLPDD